MCYNYGSGVKNASRDQERIIDQLTNLRNILEQVRKVVTGENIQTASQFPALNELIDQSDGLTRCHAELENLKSKLEPKSGRHIMKALTWPLREADVRKTLDNLERFQRLLSLALSADQTFV